MKTSGFLIFVGIAASCLLWSSQLLDQTLLPRFMALGLTLAAVLLSEILSRKEKETKPSLTQLLFLTFAVLNVLSCCWAVNKSEAVFGCACRNVYAKNFRIFKTILSKADGVTLIIYNDPFS